MVCDKAIRMREGKIPWFYDNGRLKMEEILEKLMIKLSRELQEIL